MHDTGKVLAGLAVFVAVVTVPFWYQAVAGATSAPPVLEMPAQEKQCVEPKAVMRATHMEVLNRWRDEVVRDGDRSLALPDGHAGKKSLTGTCMKCHQSKQRFCDRCHDYVGMSEPYCWSCHNAPKEQAMRGEGN